MLGCERRTHREEMGDESDAFVDLFPEPSRATGTIFLYIHPAGRRGHIPYILLNQRSRQITDLGGGACAQSGNLPQANFPHKYTIATHFSQHVPYSGFRASYSQPGKRGCGWW